MTGLVVKLNPKERLLINGAVLENSDKRCKLTILSKDSRVLRLKDAIDPVIANTPVKRAICFTQFLIVDTRDSMERECRVLRELAQLATVFEGTIGSDIISDARKSLRAGNTYGCLKLLRTLLPLEHQMLSGSHV